MTGICWAFERDRWVLLVVFVVFSLRRFSNGLVKDMELHVYGYPSMRNTSSAGVHHPGPVALPTAPGMKLSCIPSVICPISACRPQVQTSLNEACQVFVWKALTVHHLCVSGSAAMMAISAS